MALQNTQYDTIMREYDRRQLDNRRQLEARTSEVFRKIPRIEEIEQEIAAISAEKARAILRGEAGSREELRARIRELAEEREVLLLSGGFPADYLKPQYQCPLCRDTGFIDGEKCSCFKNAVLDLLYQQSNIQEILEKENFQAFSFDYYSDTIKSEVTGRTALWHAHYAVRKSLDFIEQFPHECGNLFIYGDTGVGKTFLSHCIARELLQQGAGVLYFSAYDLFRLLAEHTFSREETRSLIDLETVCQADVLIIDDLGTELTNAFVKTQLFAILNERLTNRRPMIISTNFDMETFANAYTTRIFSRVTQSFTLLNLIGQDIRVQKTLGGNNYAAK